MNSLRFSRRRFLAASACLLAPYAGAAPVLPAGFEPDRDPARDLATALEIAHSTNRRVIVDVGGEWCGWCHVLDRLFATDAGLRRVRDRSFVWLRVNFSTENPNSVFLRRWPKVSGYPHLFVLAADGRLLHSQDTDVLEDGEGYDAVAMRSFLLKWSP
jgi:thiol:disulfide interchange protein